ncbi:MAG: serpin family protein [Opitutales bacterium]
MTTPPLARCIAQLLCVAPYLAFSSPVENPPLPIAPAINQLGLDLYREQAKTSPGGNLLLSPYSIATALAMAYAGADGETRSEMQRVLHLPTDSAAAGMAFKALADQLDQLIAQSAKEVSFRRKNGGDATPIQLNVANRLFAQQGYDLRTTFKDEVQHWFATTLEELDFKHDPAGARKIINDWVAAQTHDKILDLLPAGQPLPETRLALVNALYLRAGWAEPFRESSTQPESFHLTVSNNVDVPTMNTQGHLGYAKRDGYSVVTMPYLGLGLQFVLIVPDTPDGLAGVEKQLTVETLAMCASLDRRAVRLHLPKFKIEPPLLGLSGALQALGLKTAFDLPKRSANFNRMAPRMPNDYLFIGEVFHKTWLALDENGTEAAAATAVVMLQSFGISSRYEPPPVEVRADRPFLFAIQHVETGACLFLGRVTDPR